nr:type VII secretion target [uncultured Actinoplanes sp.]
MDEAVGMDGPGFHVDIGVLEAAADGIAQTVADQRGSSLDDLDRKAGVYGHAAVHQAIETFCDRWNDGLEILVKDGEAIGDILTAAATAYRSVDDAAAGRLTSDPALRVVDD